MAHHLFLLAAIFVALEFCFIGTDNICGTAPPHPTFLPWCRAYVCFANLPGGVPCLTYARTLFVQKCLLMGGVAVAAAYPRAMAASCTARQSMTITDVQGVSPQIASYLRVSPSCEPLSEADVKQLRHTILSAVAADNSLVGFPEVGMFDIKLLDAVAAAMRLALVKGVAGARVSRAKEILGAALAIRKTYDERHRQRRRRGGTQVHM